MQTVDYSFAQLPTTTPMNRLPLVIDGPGDYVTRSGVRVTIHEVRLYAPTPMSNLRHEVTAFEAKGSPWRKVAGKLQPCGYDVWHLSGRLRAVKEHPEDIVGKWPV